MEENKRKQYAHLYEHHEVEDPQPREEKEKPIGPSGRNRHRPMVEKVCRRIAFSFLAMAVVLLLALNYFQIKEAKKEAVLEYIRKEKQQMKNRETEKTDQLAILDQYDILYSMYPDLVGWIKVDGTPIDYPVMQDLYDLIEKEFMIFDHEKKHLYTEETLQNICLRESRLFPQMPALIRWIRIL